MGEVVSECVALFLCRQHPVPHLHERTAAGTGCAYTENYAVYSEPDRVQHAEMLKSGVHM